jgi:nitrate reductase NapE component
MSTLGTPDTGQRQTNKNTTQRYCQHWVHQTQDKDKQTKNMCFCLFVFILCLVYPMLTVSLCCVFCLFVFVNTIQRYCQHWVHQTQDRDKQIKNTTQRYCQHWLHQTQDKDKQTIVPNVDSISVLWFCLFVSVLFLVYPMLTVSMCCVFCLFVFVLCLVYPQHRDTVNIGYTRHRTKTNKQKTQHIDTVNIGYTRNRTETNVFVCLSLSCVWCTQC